MGKTKEIYIPQSNRELGLIFNQIKAALNYYNVHAGIVFNKPTAKDGFVFFDLTWLVNFFGRIKDFYVPLVPDGPLRPDVEKQAQEQIDQLWPLVTRGLDFPPATYKVLYSLVDKRYSSTPYIESLVRYYLQVNFSRRHEKSSDLGSGQESH